MALKGLRGKIDERESQCKRIEKDLKEYEGMVVDEKEKQR
jgi:hypothetical protein